MPKKEKKTPETTDCPVTAESKADAEDLPAELEKLKNEIKLLSDKEKEKSDLLLRTAAEYDNFRKRTAKEKETLFKDGMAAAFASILPAVDDLMRAGKSGSADFESYRKGTEMSLSKLMADLEKQGVVETAKEGEAFDPELHTAVMHVEDEDFPENTIVSVFQQGYKMGDRIIRFASVKVAN